MLIYWKNTNDRMKTKVNCFSQILSYIYLGKSTALHDACMPETQLNRFVS